MVVILQRVNRGIGEVCREQGMRDRGRKKE